MCDLLTSDCIAELRAMTKYVDNALSLYSGKPSSAETPDLLPVDHPLDRVSAGDSFKEMQA